MLTFVSVLFTCYAYGRVKIGENCETLFQCLHVMRVRNRFFKSV